MKTIRMLGNASKLTLGGPWVAYYETNRPGAWFNR